MHLPLDWVLGTPSEAGKPLTSAVAAAHAAGEFTWKAVTTRPAQMLLWGDRLTLNLDAQLSRYLILTDPAQALALNPATYAEVLPDDFLTHTLATNPDQVLEYASYALASLDQRVLFEVCAKATPDAVFQHAGGLLAMIAPTQLLTYAQQHPASSLWAGASIAALDPQAFRNYAREHPQLALQRCAAALYEHNPVTFEQAVHAWPSLAVQYASAQLASGGSQQWQAVAPRSGPDILMYAADLVFAADVNLAATLCRAYPQTAVAAAPNLAAQVAPDILADLPRWATLNPGEALKRYSPALVRIDKATFIDLVRSHPILALEHASSVLLIHRPDLLVELSRTHAQHALDHAAQAMARLSPYDLANMLSSAEPGHKAGHNLLAAAWDQIVGPAHSAEDILSWWPQTTILFDAHQALRGAPNKTTTQTEPPQPVIHPQMRHINILAGSNQTMTAQLNVASGTPVQTHTDMKMPASRRVHSAGR